MRRWMSAHAERTRTGQQLHRGRHDLPVRLAARCLLVSADEVALRAEVRALVARVRGTSDQIEAASVAHAGPCRAGIAQRDWLGDPDLPAMRSEHGCTVGKPNLHPVGTQTAGCPGRRPAPAEVARPGYSPGTATSAVCLREPEVARSRGRDEASPAIGNGITAGAGRDAGGGRPVSPS
jgi:hypothetical protein